MDRYAASQRKVCELANIARSSYRYRARTQRNDELRDALVELAQEQPRYGYRRLGELLKRKGERVNHKRLFRVYRAAGLSVKRKRRKRLVRVGQPSFVPTRPNQQWSIDFVHDRMASGRSLRVLTVVDAFTRECLALEVDTSLPSRRVTRALDKIIAQRGCPGRIRMDNGTELTSRHFLSWGIDQRIELAHIQPGKPVQNAYAESFNGKFRDECLNVSWFQNLWDARRKIASWLLQYNQERPHSSLDYRTPNEFVEQWRAAQMPVMQT
jgi:putative transposase